MKKKRCSHKDHLGDNPLPVARFSPHPNTSDGLQSICKDCNRRLALARAKRLTAERRRAKGMEPELDFAEPEVLDYYEDPDFVEYRDDVPDDVLLSNLLWGEESKGEKD